MLNNLLYYVSRYFDGEHGIVTSIKDADAFPKDDCGNHAQEVTFVNPLGQVKTVVSETSKLVFEHDPKFLLPSVKTQYHLYKVGENFP